MITQLLGHLYLTPGPGLVVGAEPSEVWEQPQVSTKSPLAAQGP